MTRGRVGAEGMMRATPGSLSARIAMLVIAAVVAGLPLERADARAAHHRIGVRSTTYQVYLLKGFADVFSTGLDFLQAKLKARGVAAEVHSHGEWKNLADDAIDKWHRGAHGPIIIIGHSLGADAAVRMADKLGAAGVPVALLVGFSLTETLPASGNVARAITYYQSNSAWHGQIVRGAHFHGTLETVDLAKAPGIDHFNIEKMDSLHAATIAKVLSLVSTHARAGGHGPEAQAAGSNKAAATEP
jgi:hypothetical protein